MNLPPALDDVNEGANTVADGEDAETSQEDAANLAIPAFDEQLSENERHHKYVRFLIASMGSIPWIGGLIAASAAFHSETAQSKTNHLLHQWLRSHESQIQELAADVATILARIEELGSGAQARVNDEGYLSLVRASFRTWDRCDTKEKRQLIISLLANSAGSQICSDDVVRLFLEWIDKYHELHFKVLAVIYQSPGITRLEIWAKIHGAPLAEDTPEAGLFRLLIRELSVGGIIRQHRQTDGYGRFIAKPTGRRHGRTTSTFDSNEPYELSELGRQFVHYAMTDITRQLE